MIWCQSLCCIIVNALMSDRRLTASLSGKARCQFQFQQFIMIFRNLAKLLLLPGMRDIAGRGVTGTAHSTQSMRPGWQRAQVQQGHSN